MQQRRSWGGTLSGLIPALILLLCFQSGLARSQTQRSQTQPSPTTTPTLGVTHSSTAAAVHHKQQAPLPRKNKPLPRKNKPLPRKNKPLPRKNKKHSKIHARSRHTAKAAIVVQPAPPPVPPAPVYPIPPGLQPPVDAVVTYSGNQLTIDAKNSSLIQILHEVTLQTGMTVTGLTGDTRVYGRYGPGRVDDTLRKLLNGGPYNFIIIGGDATHPPTQLEFTISN